MSEKVIALIDMDCFYVQVETRENPSLKGKPAAVVQYNTWKGGGIIAVNYEARAQGVTRNMRGDQAREKCPEIVLVQVPEVREKADLTKYRNAGREVIQVLNQFGGVVERASIDEAYVDLSALVDKRLQDSRDLAPSQLPNTHIGGSKEDRTKALEEWLREVRSSEGSEYDLRLAAGAAIIEEMRAAVFQKTHFRCSAGIAHCKTLAKLCCGLNKPNKQTVLPQSAVATLYDGLAVTKVRGLGGKLGDAVVSELGVETMGQLAALSLRQIAAKFDEKTAHWLHLLGKGFDNEEVCERELPKSIGCSKNFRGPDILDTRAKVKERLGKLLEELTERILKDREEHNRTARGLTVGANVDAVGYVSRAGPLHAYNYEKIFRDAFGLLCKLNTAPEGSEAWTPPLKNISVSASKFEDLNSTLGNTQSVASFFKRSELGLDRTLSPTVKPSQASRASELCVTKSEDDGNFSPKFGEKIVKNTGNSPQHNFSDESAVGKSTPKAVGKLEIAVTKGAGGQRKANVQLASTGSFFLRKLAEMKQQEEKEEEKEEVETKARQQNADPLSDTLAASAASQRPEPSCNKKESDRHSGDVGTSHMELDSGGQSEECGIDMGELIPNLENFDPAILELLPANVRRLAEQRLNHLRSYAISRPATTKLNSHSSTIKTLFSPGATIAKSSNELGIVVAKEAAKTGGSKHDVAAVNNRTPEAAKSWPTIDIGPTSKVEVATTVDSCPKPAVEEKEEEVDAVTCSQCGRRVSPFQLPEHLDYHFAQQLEQESSRPAVRTVVIPPSAGAKRKRHSEAGKEPAKAKKSKPGSVDISSFFTKK